MHQAKSRRGRERAGKSLEAQKHLTSALSMYGGMDRRHEAEMR